METDFIRVSITDLRDFFFNVDKTKVQNNCVSVVGCYVI